jgi:hypothetical protein
VFLKNIAQNEAQSMFVKKYYITWSVESSRPNTWASSVIFKKTAQRQQSPNGRKFAQSGDPGESTV